MAQHPTKRENILFILFVLYSTLMIWLLFFRSYGRMQDLDYRDQLLQNINLTPFYTINNYARVVFQHTNENAFFHCVINLSGNIVLFMPAGLLVPAIWRKMRNLFRFLPLSAGVLFFVEVLQLFTLLGRFDIDDLILNLLGITLGFLLFCLFGKK